MLEKKIMYVKNANMLGKIDDFKIDGKVIILRIDILRKVCFS